MTLTGETTTVLAALSQRFAERKSPRPETPGDEPRARQRTAYQLAAAVLHVFDLKTLTRQAPGVPADAGRRIRQHAAGAIGSGAHRCIAVAVEIDARDDVVGAA